MTPEASLSIIVLAYNDAPGLTRLLPTLHAVVCAAAARFEIIVVDDGSLDDTAAVALQWAARLDGVRLIRHAVNQGVGAGFRTGYHASGHDVIGYIDGDAQYDPGSFRLLLEALPPRGAAIGQRVKRADPFHRLLVSFVYRCLVHLIYGLPYRDVNCGIKLFHRNFLQAAEPLFADGAFYDCEIMAKASRQSLPVVEVPVRHFPRSHGRPLGNSRASIMSASQGLISPAMAPYRRSHWTARLAVVLCRTLYPG